MKQGIFEVKENIVPISARLISNKASFKFKTEQIERLMESLARQVEEERNEQK